MEYTEITAADFDALDGVADWRVVLGGDHGRLRMRVVPGRRRAERRHRRRGRGDATPPGHRHPVSRSGCRHDHHARHRRTDRPRRRARARGVRTGGRNRRSRASSVPQAVEIAIDTMDADRIRPFWAAVLGYREQDGALVDPLRIGPPLVPADGRAAHRPRSLPHRRVGAARQRPNSGLPRRSPPAAGSSPTSSPGRGGCSPMLTVTRPASAPGRIADLRRTDEGGR